MLGIAVGAAVGKAVGAPVGGMVGTIVGTPVGAAVGMLVSETATKKIPLRHSSDAFTTETRSGNSVAPSWLKAEMTVMMPVVDSIAKCGGTAAFPERSV
jgi:hypothetical protein